MIARRLARLQQMGAREALWRGRTAIRTHSEHARARLLAPRWNRKQLARILADLPELRDVREAARDGRWDDAHTCLAGYFAHTSQRFVIAPTLRERTADRIRREFPTAARDAAARADRIVSGTFDLLGHSDLRFDVGQDMDWHYDPVHHTHAPLAFWASIPYLDPVYGDHKIVWELNRHQHWLALGRAWWLTGDVRYRAAMLSQLESWLAANPPGMGINWASMLELALRSISWTWTLNFFADDSSTSSTAWTVDLLVALDRQLLQVERHLSYYFSPNTHLLGEALALYVTGRTLPLLAASPRRETLGRRILIDEIGHQIGRDGGHLERSTHYHRYTLDFFLLALAVARITNDRDAEGPFQEAVARLACAARLLADDRGRLPHIGDDDGGAAFPIAGRSCDDIRDSLAIASALGGRSDLRIGPAPEEAFWFLAHPSLAEMLDRSQSDRSSTKSLTSAALPDTGYYVSRSPGGDHMVLDGGAHGYRNAGHAHADALSLTLSVRGVPLLIDPGTGCYTTEPLLRDRFRSTALHNTVTLDGLPQSVPTDAFHWSRTANATTSHWRVNAVFDYFEAAHDGYQPTEHRRHVFALRGDLLVVADLIVGDGEHTADAHWHVDPRWKVDLAGGRAVLSSGVERAEMVWPQGSIDKFFGDADGIGWHAPVYGRVEPAPTLRLRVQGRAPLWVVSVFGLAASNEIAGAEMMPVWAEAGVLRHALAIRIVRSASIDYFLLADRATEGNVDPHETWRIGEFETDARVLFCRTDAEGQPVRAALVDGSVFRAGGRRRIAFTLPGPTTDAHLELTGHARLSGDTAGARVQIGASDIPIEIERRGAVRSAGMPRCHGGPA